MESAFLAPPAKEGSQPEVGQFAAYLTYLTEQRTRLAAEAAALDAGRETLRNRINTLQRQLNELRGSGQRAYKHVVVRVAAETAGQLDLTLSYTVGGAG